MNNIDFNSQRGATASNAAEINVIPAAKVPVPSLADQTFAYSLFNSEKDNTPQPHERTWGDFVWIMEQHNPRKTKEGGRAFSPATYSAKAKRGNAGVLTVTMAVLDVDSGAKHEAVKSILSGLAYVIHSTWSHTAENPSYRVIIPLTAPVQNDDWYRTWAKLNHFLGDINDPATKDPARVYYMPSHPVGREDFFVEVGEGNFLDPNILPEIPVDVTPKAATQTTAISTANSVSNQPSHGQLLGAVEQLEEVQKRCAFVQWASEPTNQPKVREPEWMALITNFNCFEGGDAAIHEGSCHHPEYDEDKTDAKIERHKGKTGPITCARIRSLGFNECPEGGCKTISGKVTKAPAGLGSWGLSAQSISTVVKKPVHIAEFLTNNFPSGLYYTNESFYAYSTGAWSAKDERADIRRKIAEFFGGSAKAKTVNETLTLLKDFQSVREAEINQNKHLICLQNGTLDTNSYELIEHSPSYGLMTKTNIEWNPSATCTRWLQFLEQIFVNDMDKAQKIAFVKEWFGYCLVPDSSLHKFVMMVGAGGNGKSVLLFILTQLVGSSNVSHAHIERLDEKYVRAELEGKLVNISSEMSADATISDGYLKAIVAGDIVEAERKFKPSFSFRPYSRLIGATNGLPRLLDHSEGFARRAIILSFNRIFAEHEQDHALEQTLLNELPGILKWAVDGLIQLRERRKFDIPQSSTAALAQYRKESDPDRLFVEECLIIDQNCKGMKSNDIYSGYVAWCKASGYRAKAKVSFGKRLAEFGIESKRSAVGTRWLVKPNPEMETMWYEPANHWDLPILNHSDRYILTAPDQTEAVEVLVTPQGFKL